jgi:hypothetical protein
MMDIYQEKMEQAGRLMAEFNLDTWLVFVRETAEHTDPVIKLLGPLNAVWEAALSLAGGVSGWPSPVEGMTKLFAG